MTAAGAIFLLIVIAVMAVFSIAIAHVLLPGALRNSTAPSGSDTAQADEVQTDAGRADHGG